MRQLCLVELSMVKHEKEKWKIYITFGVMHERRKNRHNSCQNEEFSRG